MDPWAYITIVPVIPICHLSISTHNWSLVNYLFGFYPFKFLKSYYHCIAIRAEKLSIPWTEPCGIIGWDRTKSIECKPHKFFFPIMYPGFKFLHTNLFIYWNVPLANPMNEILYRVSFLGVVKLRSKSVGLTMQLITYSRFEVCFVSGVCLCFLKLHILKK